jgi:hypothetical protein
MSQRNHLEEADLDRLARRRAGAKMGWYIHLTVYLLVNAMLIAIAASSGRGWAIFPVLGWGLGLAIHGAVVFLLTDGSGLFSQMVGRERERLSLQRDPW